MVVGLQGGNKTIVQLHLSIVASDSMQNMSRNNKRLRVKAGGGARKMWQLPQDLHGPGDVWFWDSFHQTQQRDISFWTSQNLFLSFFQVHSRRNCKYKFWIYLIKECNVFSHIVIDMLILKKKPTIDDHGDRELFENGPSCDLCLTGVRPSILSFHILNDQCVIRQLPQVAPN